jgi:hypothetical protein
MAKQMPKRTMMYRNILEIQIHIDGMHLNDVSMIDDDDDVDHKKYFDWVPVAVALAAIPAMASSH